MNLLQVRYARSRPWEKEYTATELYRDVLFTTYRYTDETIGLTIKFPADLVFNGSLAQLLGEERVKEEYWKGTTKAWQTYCVGYAFNLPGDFIPLIPYSHWKSHDAYRDIEYVKKWAKARIDEALGTEE